MDLGKLHSLQVVTGQARGGGRSFRSFLAVMLLICGHWRGSGTDGNCHGIPSWYTNSSFSKYRRLESKSWQILFLMTASG